MGKHIRTIDKNEILPGDISNPELLLQRDVCKHDNRVSLDQIIAQGLTIARHSHIIVELGQLWAAHFGTVSAHIRLREVEVRREVCNLNILCIVKCNGLHSAEDNILGDLSPEAFHAGDEDVRDGHLLHGLVAHDVQLPGVEALVDCIRGAVRSVPILSHLAVLSVAGGVVVLVHSPVAVVGLAVGGLDGCAVITF